MDVNVDIGMALQVLSERLAQRDVGATMGATDPITIEHDDDNQ